MQKGERVPLEVVTDERSRNESTAVWLTHALVPSVAALLLALSLGAVWDHTSPPALRLVVATGAVFLLALTAAWWRARRRDALRRAPLSAGAEGIFVGDALTFPRARIQRVLVLPREDGSANVHVHARDRWFSVRAVNAEAGHRVVTALGMDASRYAMDFCADPPPEVVRAVASALLSVSLVGLLAGAFLVVGVVGATLAAFALFTPSRVRVGADGVEIRWTGWRRFLPMDRIATCEKVRGGLVFTLRDGSKRNVMTYFTSVGVAEDAGYSQSTVAWRDAIHARVMEAGAVAARRDTARAARLDREGRDAEAWVAALRERVRDGDATYREPAPPVSELWASVEDARAQPDARIAAALALGPSLDERGVTRVRVAAETAADERVRVALDAVASQDEASALRALDALTRGK